MGSSNPRDEANETVDRTLFEERAFAQRFLMSIKHGSKGQYTTICGHIEGGDDFRLGGPRNWCGWPRGHEGSHRHFKYGSQVEHAEAMTHQIPVPEKQFPFSVDCPPKDEFLKRDEKGLYLDPTLNAMWWAWCESRKLDVLKHHLENVAIRSGVQLPLRVRAERFLRTSSPHHRVRQWYTLIEELLTALPKEPK